LRELSIYYDNIHRTYLYQFNPFTVDDFHSTRPMPARVHSVIASKYTKFVLKSYHN
jgi:hypothetical protein